MTHPHRLARGTGAEAAGQIHSDQLTATPLFLQIRDVTAAASRRIDETACQFLRLILPERGNYAALIVKSDKQKYNIFAPTIEHLWASIKQADGAGHTAYHACAAFKEARHDPKGTPPAKRQFGRTKHNAAGAKALWLDVDAGPGKPYADCHVACEAVAAFCKAAELPEPLLVLSGLGMHVYWPLDRTLDPETWKGYALGLKMLCVKHGLHADPVRTADITSVLRTPGTYHRKAGVRLVQCGELVAPYAVQQFEYQSPAPRLHGSPKRPNPLEGLGPIPAYLRNQSRVGERMHDVLARTLSGTYEPSYGEVIAERCHQLRALRDERGKLPEPSWYACLGVLAHCEDGDRLGHEWSSGDPRYTEHETQGKLDRARQFGPTTCVRFRDINADGCKRCPWLGKTTSPISLGKQITCGQRS